MRYVCWGRPKTNPKSTCPLEGAISKVVARVKPWPHRGILDHRSLAPVVTLGMNSYKTIQGSTTRELAVFVRS